MTISRRPCRAGSDITLPLRALLSERTAAADVLADVLARLGSA